MTKTPFDLIYERLLRDVNDDVALKELRSKNVVAYVSDSDPTKSEHIGADFPELTLYMTGLSGNLHGSSTVSKLTTRWRFQVVTDSYNSRYLHKFQFACIRVMTRWIKGKADLLWKDRVFIKDCRLVTGNQGIASAENSTNITGWATLLDFEIDVSLLTSDLIEND